VALGFGFLAMFGGLGLDARDVGCRYLARHALLDEPLVIAPAGSFACASLFREFVALAVRDGPVFAHGLGDPMNFFHRNSAGQALLNEALVVARAGTLSRAPLLGDGMALGDGRQGSCVNRSVDADGKQSGEGKSDSAHDVFLLESGYTPTLPFCRLGLLICINEK
jgi:hypothetical protein